MPPRRSKNDPSSLIHTDRERSFHLVSKATEVVDYRAPFAPTEQDAEAQFDIAENYLREATELDPRNWDAQRMLATLQSESDDELISYLLDHRADVERDVEHLLEDASNPYEEEFARDLGQRPLQRWIAMLASRLFIAGQYRMALMCAEEGLRAYPLDMAGIRHTGMLALAKLEVRPRNSNATVRAMQPPINLRARAPRAAHNPAATHRTRGALSRR